MDSIDNNEYNPILLEKWIAPVTQRMYIGDGAYCIGNLHSLAKDLTVKEMPMEHLNISKLGVGDCSLAREFAMHMRAVQKADLDFPIILDEDGFVLDGRHRIIKALVEGKTHIKFVRFTKNPEPDYYEKDDKD